MEPSDPRATLDALIHERGSDYTSLSRLLGRNAAYIQQYVKRGVPRKLDADDRRVLARYFGVDEMVLGAAPPPRSPAIVMVPRLELGASAGPGALADGERVRDQLGFAADWLRARGARRLEMLSVLQVSGDVDDPDAGRWRRNPGRSRRCGGAPARRHLCPAGR